VNWRNNSDEILQMVKQMPHEFYSRRYQQVADGLNKGLSPVEISELLGITSNRVYQIIKNIPGRIKRMQDRLRQEEQRWIEKQHEYRLLSEETVSE
jgi:DNA-directed RNA polymerase specialized sigma subunit